MQPIVGRAEISYPCSWTYRVICYDEASVRAALPVILDHVEHTLRVIGDSESGRYRRLEIIATVRDEEHRNAIFVALGRVPSVRFVL